MVSRSRLKGEQLPTVHRLLLGAVIVCVAAAAALVRPADAGSEIRLGAGIGPLRLGMTEEQVRRALGRPSAVQRTRAGRIFIVSMNYYLRGDYRVTLRGPRGAVRATLIGTVAKDQKTRAGVGIGSSEKDVRDAYPSAGCRNVRGSGGGVVRGECRVGPRSRRHTIFVIGRGPNPPEVVEVLVAAGGS